jgi:hypothetical protein
MPFRAGNRPVTRNYDATHRIREGYLEKVIVIFSAGGCGVQQQPKRVGVDARRCSHRRASQSLIEPDPTRRYHHARKSQLR